MTKKICCIYAIVSPSGRAYIGSTKDFRTRKATHRYTMKNGKHACSALQRAHDKYGLDAMDFRIIENCSEEDRISREQWWIDNHSNYFGRIYNSSSIAGRPEHTAEVRKKISDKAKLRGPVSLETREKLAAVWRGRKHSEETKAKMRANGLRSITPEAVKKLVDANKGRKRTEEEKEKIRQAKIGTKASDETKAKMSAAQLRRNQKSPMTRETVDKFVSARRKANNNNRNKTSVYKGVYLAGPNRWRAAMTVNGKVIYIGSFKTEAEAALAYNLKATEIFGSDTFLNEV